MNSHKIACMNDLIELLKNTAVVVDNVPVDRGISRKIIQTAKLSILINSIICSKKINSYLKNPGFIGRDGNGEPYTRDESIMIFEMPEPFPLGDTSITEFYVIESTSWFYICSPSHSDTYHQTGPVRFYLENTYLNLHPNSYDRKVINHELACKQVIANLRRFLAKYPLYTLLQPITPYKSPEAAFHFFDVSPMPYAPIQHGLNTWNADTFLQSDDENYWSKMKEKHPDRSEATLIENEVNRILLERNPDLAFQDVYSSVCEDWMKQVFDFKDACGFVMMKVFKTYNYDVTGSRKVYLPATVWMQNDVLGTKYFSFPWPKQQFLYNLHLISDAEIVVICPCLEIADHYQRKHGFSNLVFTAFLCDEGHFEEVDFSPLKGKAVYLLAMNHSGLTLAEIYVEVKKLQRHLLDREKLEVVKVIQLSVDYAPMPNFMSLAQLMDHYRSHKKPAIIPGSVLLMDTEEAFMTNYNNALAEIERKKNASLDKHFWQPDENSQMPPTVGEATSADEDGEMLLRPIVFRGNITYVNGDKGIGKSNLLTSLLAQVVNTSKRGKSVFAERCWTPSNVKSPDKQLKVVWLDYENGKSGSDIRIEDFALPYWPQAKESLDICKANFIVKNMIGNKVNYSEKSHYDDFLKFLNQIEQNEGVQGHPIDILVVDTYWSFCSGKDTHFEVFNQLRANRPNMAIVVLHHLNEGKVYGRTDKLFAAGVIVEISRYPKRDGATLHVPFQIKTQLRFGCIPEDMEEFTVKRDDNDNWMVCNPKHTEAEMIKILAAGYKKSQKKNKDEIAGLLGIGTTKLDEILKNEN